MAVGETRFPAMPGIEGLRLGTAMAGIKKPGRRDLVVIEIAEGATVAGSFTLNAFCAAPVTVAKANLAGCQARGEGLASLSSTPAMPMPVPARSACAMPGPPVPSWPSWPAWARTACCRSPPG